MEQYCIYLRKSRTDIEAEARGEMETLARHEKMLMDLSKSMELPVTEIYREIVSGETISSRPVVQRLIEEVEQGKWVGVLVVEIERLARGDTIDQGIVARAFKVGGAKIITPVKTYDPENEFDEEYFEFGLFMSRREYKTINRRIQRGRIASAKEGKFLSSTPPYGYDKVKLTNDKGYTLTPNKDEAPVVKMIYRLYNKGYGMTPICDKLDKMRIIPRNRDTWSKSTVNDILKNPVYIGKIRWSYREEKSVVVSGVQEKKRRVNNDCILVDGLHEPLISQEEFDAAQEMRQKNTRVCVKKNLKLKNPLSGLVYCGKCGTMMTRLSESARNRYAALKCPCRSCDNVSAPIFLVEDKIIYTIQTWLDKYQVKNQETIVPDKSINMWNATLDKLRTERNNIRAQIAKTYDLVEQGIYTNETFIQRNKELAERKSKTENDIMDIETKLKIHSVVNQRAKLTVPALSGVVENYSSLSTATEKNALLRTVIHRIDYIKEKPNTRGKLNNSNFELNVYPIPYKEKYDL